MAKNLDAALYYRQKMGFSVIPIRPNKKPYVAWEKYQTTAATMDQVEKWWGKWPGAGIGIVTGETSGVMVVDVDSPEGREALGEFLPDSLITPMVATPGGGWHFYFQYRAGLVNRARVITDCDVRTDGGYAIAPPSTNGTGKAYAWIDGLRISDVAPAAMPEMLFDILQQGGMDSAGPSPHINNSIYANTRGRATSEPQQSITNRNKRNINFDEGSRDETLFHIANCLAKGGMDYHNALKCLQFIGSHCSKPFPEKEIHAKVESAFKRSKNRNRNLTAEVREWISATWGNITATEALQNVTNATMEDRKKIRVILGRLVNDEILERVPGKNGVYRKVETDLEVMDFTKAESESLNVWLPFNMHKLVELMPGNIILLAGEPNAGKTGLLFNIILGNMRGYDIHYFNSEMGAGELRKRLSKFKDVALDAWKFHAYERSSNFADVIKPGKGKINIIDFLEIHENFYEVGGILAEIHRKLKGAIAIVALQKNKDTDTGLGGFRTLEKPRLALAMSQGVLKIVKAKNWAGERNPNGLQVEFKVVQGCDFIQTKGWHDSS